MINEYYALYAMKKLITGIDQEHLEAVIDALRAYHASTGDQLPGGNGWLDLVRAVVAAKQKEKETQP